MKINEAALRQLLDRIAPIALSGFDHQIRRDMSAGSPYRAKRKGQSGQPHLRDSFIIEKESDSTFIGSRQPYTSVAEHGERRDGTYRWRNQTLVGFMKRALYRTRAGRRGDS